MRRNLWKKVTSATLCAAMVGGIMVSNGALAVQAEEGEEKEVITLRVMGETGMDGISTDDAVGRYIKEKLGIVLEYTNVSTDRLKVMASGGDLPDIVELHNGDIDVKNLIDAGSLWAMDDWLAENGDNLKEKLPQMTEDEQLKLLATNGMLVKRPLVVGEDFVLTGFREKEWEEKIRG